jgi:hypothetical protein
MKKIMLLWSGLGPASKIAIGVVVAILIIGAVFGEPSVVEPVK